jgi:hypothetical protein
MGKFIREYVLHVFPYLPFFPVKTMRKGKVLFFNGKESKDTSYYTRKN